MRALLVILLCLITSAASTAQETIPWRLTTDMDDRSIVAQGISPVERLGELGARFAGGRIVVQFDAPLGDGQREALREAGVSLLAPLGNRAYFARLDAGGVDLDRVTAAATLTEASQIRVANKIHPAILAGERAEWAQVGEAADGDPIVGAYVIFHRDVDLFGEGIPAIASHADVFVQDELESVNGLVVELPLSAFERVARDGPVQWIEPALPRLAETNSLARTLTQAEIVQASPYDLDGAGVNVLVYDAGTVMDSHTDFAGRVNVRDASGTHYHATHVAGSIGGSGAASDGSYRGMAPGASIESYGYQHDGSGILLYTNPGDFESDYDEAINSYGVDIANNSINSNVASNGRPCFLQGDYGTMSSLVDAIVRGSLGAPFRIMFAAGNERETVRCRVENLGDYFAMSPPASAKNHITVGAVNSDDDAMAPFSSWGPTGDGRLKPDVCAPGSHSNGSRGIMSTTDWHDDAYEELRGTSMAVAVATGLCTLILEDYRVQFPEQDDPRNSTLKVLLAHNAVDRGNVGPDYQFGYGSVRVKDTIDFMRTGQFTEDTVSAQSAVVYTVEALPAASELKLTLAWDDFPATPNVNPTLVNDLDLRVFDPVGGRHYPWTLNPAVPSAGATRNNEDHVNNIEQVFVSDPMPGTWTVIIYGADVPEGPQPYSLASSAALAAPSLEIGLPSGAVQRMSPGNAAAFEVEIVESGDTFVPGSATMHFRYDGGAFLSQTLTPTGEMTFAATLPAAICGATVEYYLTAEGDVNGTVSSPGPGDAVYTATVEALNIHISDDFETTGEWTVDNSFTLTSGWWERGVPAGNGNRGDPLVDFDGSGACWLTENVPGDSDVDAGTTKLISPVYDLSGLTDPVLSLGLWFANDLYDADRLAIKTSVDGGSWWTTLAELKNTDGWVYREYDISAAVSSTFRLRFQVSDIPSNGSVTEAAVDALRIFTRTCDAILDDCNGNRIEDGSEITLGIAADVNGDGVPDECGCTGDLDGDNDVDLSDLAQLLSNYGDPRPMTYQDGDLNGDGDVDLSDLAGLLSVYGTTCN